MKNRIVICFCLLLFAPDGVLFAQKGSLLAGIEGGPGLSLIYSSQGVYSQSEPSLAGVAGISGEYGFATAFSAKMALHYERVSTRSVNHSAILPQGGKLQYNLDYLSLPVLVKWYFGKRHRFFVNAGPCLSLLLQESLFYLPESGSREKVAGETSAYNPLLLSVAAGAGVAFPVGKHLVVTLELRDNFGVTNIRSSVSDFESNSYFITGEVKGYTNSALLLAGISYRFGGGKGMPCTPDDPTFQYLKE